MPKVNREELGSMYIPLPRVDEQIEIAKVLQTIDEAINCAVEEIAAFKKLHNSLIQQVF
jgi:restriction endonuclease S subunit